MLGTAWSRIAKLCSTALFVVALIMMLASHRSAVAALTLPPNQQMYALYGRIIGVTDLFRIDVATSTATFIGSTGFQSMGGLAAGPDGKLYSWDRDYGLVSINRTTGIATDVNSALPSAIPGHFLSIDVAPNGNIVGTLQRGSGNEIYEIDRSTGAVVAMREQPLPPAHPFFTGIAFVGKRLFAVNGFPNPSWFFEIDPNSAATRVVGSTGKPNLESLAADLHGNIFSMSFIAESNARNSFDLVRIDPRFGVTAESMSIRQAAVPVNYGPKALAIVTVPEPVTSSWALCGGCAVLWTQCRRGRELRRRGLSATPRRSFR
jgi:hypothetical protein